jgi:hypothetical protein
MIIDASAFLTRKERAENEDRENLAQAEGQEEEKSMR